MPTLEPIHFFNAQIQQAETQLKQLKKRLNTLSLLRILVFITGVGIAVFFANERNTILTIVSLLITAIVFLLLLKHYNVVSFQLNYAKQLAKLNKEELARTERNLTIIEDEGLDFENDDHPYASDLDIFGKASLFKFLNRTATSFGRNLLAQWLKNPSRTEEVSQRQGAAKEMAQKKEWCQDFLVKGNLKSKEQSKDVEQLLHWLQSPLPKSVTNYLLPATILLSLIFLGSIALFVLGKVSLLYPILALVINFFYLGARNKEVQNILLITAKSSEYLKSYAQIMACVENLEATSSKLTSLQKVFIKEGKRASEAIKTLGQILFQLEVRQNLLFFALVNNPFVFENIPLYRLKKWKEEHKEDFRQWIEALAEIDALVSLGSAAYANPSFTFPNFSEEQFYYDAKQIGHPLLKPTQRVDNDFSLAGKGNIALITGSNMAGKTTFERTLGVNAVMALAGAPVCAEMLTLSYMEVYSSMRIKDSLEESVSSFYAELKRFKGLLELLENEGSRVFFLLDELLRGTNSADRHDGIRAIMKQLIGSNGFGLISTHDLKLADMAAEFPAHIRNYSFNSRIENDKLIFDYKLEDGKCYSYSASKLMEMMGINLKNADK